MIRLLLLICPLMFASIIHAQFNTGTITYERTAQLQMRMNTGAGMETSEPRTKVDRYELIFGDSKMLWHRLENEQDDDVMAGNGQLVIRTFTGGADDATFCDFKKASKVESREFFETNFIITDSIRNGQWKITDDTKDILGHPCRKAIGERISKRLQMSMNNGVTSNTEVADTSELIVWFANDISIPAGPEVQGQLPGLILELEMDHGRVVYKAVEISPKANLNSIKAPSKGKKVTPDEFIAERKKLMDKMEKNNGGGAGNTIMIRMN